MPEFSSRDTSRSGSVPPDIKAHIESWATRWLGTFARLLQLRAVDPGPYNYPVEVFSEWRGSVFYLNVRYRSRSRDPKDDFVVRKARMTATGFGRFDLAYFRHTGRWCTVHKSVTAPVCIREIEANEVFWPTM